MGRGKIDIRRIENKTNRQVTFAKRRTGLLKKANELSVLCDAQIGLVIFSGSGRMFEYCSEMTSMDQIIKRYLGATGNYVPEHSEREQVQVELRRMRKETQKLQLSVERYTASNLSAVQLEELAHLENQLECSVNKVRARKFELLEQQMSNLRRKGKIMQEENEEIYHMLKGHQMLELRHPQMAMEPLGKLVEVNDQEAAAAQQRHMALDQFSFFGNQHHTNHQQQSNPDQPSSSNANFLQLASSSTFPPPPDSFNPFTPFQLWYVVSHNYISNIILNSL